MFVRSAVHSFLNVMIVPSGFGCNFLLADWTYSVLFSPETDELASAFECFGHLPPQPFLKVQFPCWVKGVGNGSDSNMPSDRHFANVEKLAFFSFVYSEKDPVIEAYPFEVLPFAPPRTFVPVSPQSPSVQADDNLVV